MGVLRSGASNRLSIPASGGTKTPLKSIAAFAEGTGSTALCLKGTCFSQGQSQFAHGPVVFQAAAEELTI